MRYLSSIQKYAIQKQVNNLCATNWLVLCTVNFVGKNGRKIMGFFVPYFRQKTIKKGVEKMERFLMISECEHCEHCTMDLPCPSCANRYAYWSNADMANNPDNAHYTGWSEQEVRKEMETMPKLKFWAKKADEYYN